MELFHSVGASILPVVWPSPALQKDPVLYWLLVKPQEPSVLSRLLECVVLAGQKRELGPESLGEPAIGLDQAWV